METPQSIVKDEANYITAAWQDYTLDELGHWVHLLARRAEMRAPGAIEKARKDLTDAQAYLDMAQAHLNAVKARVG